MVKRLVVGLVLGLVLGAAAAAVVMQGLGIASFGTIAVFAYLAAAATGAITGLVAGKPIWSADGKIEAGLKSFFGALLGLGAMFVIRQWIHVHVDLGVFKAGAGELGDLPGASLPLIAAVLAGFFELDNSGAAKSRDAESKASATSKVRVAATAEAEEEDDVEEVAAQKKRR